MPHPTGTPRSVSRPLLLAALIALLLVLFAPARAGAQIDPDLRAGVYTDESDGFVGGGVNMQVTGRWFFNPNAELVFVDNGDLVTVNADFHRDLAEADWPVDFWLGGGPALVIDNPDRGDDETDFGFNLLAGVGFLRGAAVRPYVQGKIVLSDETQAVMAFGVRF
jgi:hypothetical protein